MMPEGVVECAECGAPCRGCGGGRCNRCQRIAEDQASRGRVLALVDAAARYAALITGADETMRVVAAVLAARESLEDAIEDVTPDEAAALRRLWEDAP